MKRIPFWVYLLDQIYFPSARPPLHRFLALDGVDNQVIIFELDKGMNLVHRCKTMCVMIGLMLPNTAWEISRNAKI
jgi:hypothetical protein